MSERKKTIYCFAPNYGWDNQQLVKNCGALPLVFHKKYGFIQNFNDCGSME